MLRPPPPSGLYTQGTQPGRLPGLASAFPPRQTPPTTRQLFPDASLGSPNLAASPSPNSQTLLLGRFLFSSSPLQGVGPEDLGPPQPGLSRASAPLSFSWI